MIQEPVQVSLLHLFGFHMSATSRPQGQGCLDSYIHTKAWRGPENATSSRDLRIHKPAWTYTYMTSNNSLHLFHLSYVISYISRALSHSSRMAWFCYTISEAWSVQI